MLPLCLLIIAQLTFNVSDLMARYYMSRNRYTLATFLTTWFLAYILIRMVATMLQLYVFTSFELGKTITLAGVVGLVVANVLGLLVLKEQLSIMAYVGVAFAVLAFLLVGFAKQV